jgi:hypothetical protein
VVLAAVVLAGVLLIVVLATGWAGGGNSGVTTVGGNPSTVVYQAGHRPLAPEFRHHAHRLEAELLVVPGQGGRAQLLGIMVRAVP